MTFKNIIKKTFPNYSKSFIHRTYVHLHKKLLSSRFALFFSKVKYKKPKMVGTSDHIYFEGKRIIVSLTSFPARIVYVEKVINSLLQQTLKPNILILWLAESQFPNKNNDLPVNLLELQKYGLTIKWTEDLKSYKKLIPVLQTSEYSEDIIVTADDDIFYSSYWLQSLVDSYKENPKAIHCGMITKTKRSGDVIEFMPVYSKKGDGSYSYTYKILGCGGILYPPHSLYKDVLNKSIFMNLAPSNDDVWFWLMAVKNGYKLRWVKNNMHVIREVPGVSNNTPSLFEINNIGENRRLKETINTLNEYDLWWIYDGEN